MSQNLRPSPGASLSELGDGPWREILVPVRGGADAYARAKLAKQLARCTGGRVTALYVWDERLLGGSVAETILSGAKCAVLAVPPGALAPLAVPLG